ncbi:unnamed protein product [Ranitomeya imitator]|uniref:Ribosomal RNA-processing protein 14/surfeit locus protein 6 C-terminal domain-containing protein n=1 Tax=Ranitomeya imitator TaxID=111125 RepID=A0ABN9L6Y1_9NEOB|nr:unnamed protein product [Ranitomeya imitator]
MRQEPQDRKTSRAPAGCNAKVAVGEVGGATDDHEEEDDDDDDDDDDDEEEEEDNDDDVEEQEEVDRSKNLKLEKQKPSGQKNLKVENQKPSGQKKLKVKVTAGTVRLEDKARTAEREKDEEKRLAIMMMKKKEKYLYNKIMFGKKRKVREANKLAVKRKAHDEASKSERKGKKAKKQ